MRADRAAGDVRQFAAGRRRGRIPLPASSGLASPLGGEDVIRAVLFDVDGTLYRQAPVRRLMALELAALPLRRPFTAATSIRVLRAYRRAHEELRYGPSTSIATDQIARAAAAARVPVAAARDVVDEWMGRRPLKHLSRWRAPGLLPLLDRLGHAGVALGVLSDYPSHDKLAALGLRDRFSQVLCTTDAPVGALKPSPRGFLHACAAWGLPPRQVLMIGDRPDADAAGAAAAGMPCVIVHRGAGPARRESTYLLCPTFERLADVLDRRR